ncbi:hypothetical protein QCD60_14610 [Pokkaliibacter sp. MBI-7]|uniref:hypothetical protein n=1 Tax=Pokkaliibacter sp. MBI-7 TaxID=3040600 RepID=UPI0024475344|nr:hypothetical protein [Pokkaliibacter sp. MBI-7]MDH2433802.1 hypothetical protein [Pokkaliibacter sp. MBI-7]
MGSVTFVLPKIAAADLVFDAAETREILAFFWPHQTTIASLAITDSVREFAQGLLIVAVDASYAMGYIDILVNVLIKRKPGSSIKSLVTKLVKKNVKHWWKHAQQKDLLDAKIYETVRATIALKQKTQLDMYLNGLAQVSDRTRNLVVLNKSSCTAAWV